MNRPTRFLLAALVSTLFLSAGAIAQPPSKPSGGDAPKAQPTTDAPKGDHPKGEHPKSDQPKGDKKDDKPTGDAKESEYEYVRVSTAKGDIYMRLDKTKAPLSTENFLKYVDKKFYDNTLFHRTVKDFVIQGGGYGPDLKQKQADPPIKNESKNGLKNKKGTVAMARLAPADSATCEFYINLKDNDQLDYPREASDNAAYAVFGNVVAGLKVAEQIGQVRTTAKNGSRPDGKTIRLEDTPGENVLIKTVTRTTKEEAEKAAAGDK